MTDVLPAGTARVLRSYTPARDEALTDMEAHAAATDYPIVGPEVGRLLAVLTRLAGVERAFEFGSGFGYSAYWIASALPDGGQVVLTDVEEAHLERARAWFADVGVADRAAFELGDAHDTFERVDGPFDMVVLDHYNRHYVDAYEAAKERLSPGGVIVADNVLSGASVHLDAIVGHVDGEPVEVNDNTAGTIAFLETVTADPLFDTSLLPLGDGVSVSVSTG